MEGRVASRTAIRRKLSSVSCTHLVARHARRPRTQLAATFEGLVIPDEVQPLFEPLRIGRYELAHRIVLAPLTRCRAFGTIPQSAAAEYYSQRASAGGLLISEATCVSPQGHGYLNQPGIYTKEHVKAWKPIVKAVHDKGGVFFMQICHVGRASHPDFHPSGATPICSSAISISESSTMELYTPKGGPFKYTTPRALAESEIPGVVQQFSQAAENAVEAGFDGVEIHASNGLIDQFTRDSINKRTDSYGGPIENRIRFGLEVASAVASAIGSDKAGIRLSPSSQDFLDSTPYATYTLLLERLNPLGLAYVHMIEPRMHGMHGSAQSSMQPFRIVSTAPFIAAGGYSRSSGQEAVRSGHTDAVAFGRFFLANPDLPRRFLLDAPLNDYDRSTFYSQGLEGYTDYPTLEQLQQA